MIDPVSAAINAVATHLETFAAFPTVVRGWPEYEQTVDLGATFVVAVFQRGKGQTISHGPRVNRGPYADPDNAGEWLGLMSVGITYFDLQISVWSDYKAQAQLVHQPMTEALNPEAFCGFSGLRLGAMADYWDQLISFDDVAEHDHQEDKLSAQRGAWHKAWSLGTQLPVLVESKVNVLNVIQLDKTVSNQG